MKGDVMWLHNLLKIAMVMLFMIASLGAADTKRGAFIGGKDVNMPSWFSNSFLDLGEDIEELATNDKRLLLFIHQPNCPYCHRFVTKVLEEQSTKDKILKNFAVVDINMFGDREVTDVDGESYTEKEFAKKYGVQFTPTVIFYDENAKQILRLNGYMNGEKFNVALDYVAAKEETQVAYKDYFVQKMNLKTNKALIDEKDLFTKSSNFIRSRESAPFVLFFESANCSDCLVLHNKLLKDKIARELLKRIDVFQVDLDSSNSIVTPNRVIVKIKDWAKTLKITNSPTIIFFDNRGEEIIRIESMLKTFHFQSIVDYVVSGAYVNEKEFQRYLTIRANTIRDKGIDVNIWE
jgi:thioredoxin-related protein